MVLPASVTLTLSLPITNFFHITHILWILQLLFLFFFNKTNHFIFYFFINIFQENIVIYFEFWKARTKSIWSVLEGKKNTWLWFTLVSCQSIDTRVTPHSSPLIILSTLTNSLIPKTKDKFIIWHLQQHVHGTSFINVPTCMSALAVWFENLFIFE